MLRIHSPGKTAFDPQNRPHDPLIHMIQPIGISIIVPMSPVPEVAPVQVVAQLLDLLGLVGMKNVVASQTAIQARRADVKPPAPRRAPRARSQ